MGLPIKMALAPTTLLLLLGSMAGFSAQATEPYHALYPCQAQAFAQSTGAPLAQDSFYLGFDRDSVVRLPGLHDLTMRIKVRERQTGIDTFVPTLIGSASGRNSFLRGTTDEAVFGNRRSFGWIRCGAGRQVESFFQTSDLRFFPVEGLSNPAVYEQVTDGACLVGKASAAVQAIRADWRFAGRGTLEATPRGLQWEEVKRQCDAWGDPDSDTPGGRACLASREISRTVREIPRCRQ